MENCVNISSKEFVELQSLTNINKYILSAKVKVWQDNNGYDNFPQVKDILESGNVNYVLSIINTFTNLNERKTKLINDFNNSKINIDQLLSNKEFGINKYQQELFKPYLIENSLEDALINFANKHTHVIKIVPILQDDDSIGYEHFFNEGSLYVHYEDDYKFFKDFEEISPIEYDRVFNSVKNRNMVGSNTFKYLSAKDNNNAIKYDNSWNYVEEQIVSPFIYNYERKHSTIDPSSISWFRYWNKDNIAEINLIQSDIYQDKYININNELVNLIGKNWLKLSLESIIDYMLKKDITILRFPQGNNSLKIQDYSVKEAELETLLRDKNALEHYYNTGENFDAALDVINIRYSYKPDNISYYSQEDMLTYIDLINDDIETNKGSLNSLGKGVYNFYQEVIPNTLKKLGYNLSMYQDEYNNDWFEINVSKTPVNKQIVFQDTIKTDILSEEEINEGNELSDKIADIIIGSLANRRGITKDDLLKRLEIISENEMSDEQLDLIKNKRGAILRNKNKSIILLSKLSDSTTLLHELAHEFERDLTSYEISSVLKWTNHERWTTNTSELFARGFEKFLYEGKVDNVEMQSIFIKFAKFLTKLIQDFTIYFKGVPELNSDMKTIYNKLIKYDSKLQELKNKPEFQELSNLNSAEKSVAIREHLQNTFPELYRNIEIVERITDMDGYLSLQSDSFLNINIKDPFIHNYLLNNSIPIKIKKDTSLQEILDASKEIVNYDIQKFLIDGEKGLTDSQKRALINEALNNEDPEAQRAGRYAQSNFNDNKVFKPVVDSLNTQRLERLEEWKQYITEGNTEYANNPFIQKFIWDMITKGASLSNADVTSLSPQLNQGILAEIIYDAFERSKEIIIKLPKSEDVLKIYSNKLADLALSSQKKLEVIGKNNTVGKWIYIPSMTEDTENFEANVKKLQALSYDGKNGGRSWCTKTFNAKPYLEKGGFYLYIEKEEESDFDSFHTKIAIRLNGNKIQEIQGHYNDGTIPLEYLEQIEQLRNSDVKLHDRQRLIQNNISNWEEKVDKAKKDFETAIREFDNIKAEINNNPDMLEVVNANFTLNLNELSTDKEKAKFYSWYIKQDFTKELEKLRIHRERINKYFNKELNKEQTKEFLDDFRFRYQIDINDNIFEVQDPHNVLDNMPEYLPKKFTGIHYIYDFLGVLGLETPLFYGHGNGKEYILKKVNNFNKILNVDILSILGLEDVMDSETVTSKERKKLEEIITNTIKNHPLFSNVSIMGYRELITITSTVSTRKNEKDAESTDNIFTFLRILRNIEDEISTAVNSNINYKVSHYSDSYGLFFKVINKSLNNKILFPRKNVIIHNGREWFLNYNNSLNTENLPYFKAFEELPDSFMSQGSIVYMRVLDEYYSQFEGEWEKITREDYVESYLMDDTSMEEFRKLYFAVSENYEAQKEKNQNSSSLLKDLFNLSMSNNNIEGIYNPLTDSIQLSSDSINTLERAEQVFLHEVVGHRGVENLLSNVNLRKYNNIILGFSKELDNQVLSLIEKSGYKDIASFENDYGFKQGSVEFYKELLARVAENQKIYDNNKSWFDRLLLELKMFLSNIFKINYTNSDIAQFLIKARKSAINSKPINQEKQYSKLNKFIDTKNISDLFESLPELANEIYVTLGFRNHINFYVDEEINKFKNDKNTKIISIETIFNLERDDITKKLIKVLSPYLNKASKIYYQDNYNFKVDNELVSESGYAATIDGKGNILIFDRNSLDADTVLHELMHDFLYDAININKDEVLIDELTRLFNKAKQNSDLVNNYSYAFSNLDEFVSEVFGNKGFRRELSYIEDINLNKKSNIFKSISDAIKNLLKRTFNFQISDTLLDNIFNAVVGTIKNKNLITPQQKQQAQQLYSSYLDTIFPNSKVTEIDNSLYTSVINQLVQENKLEKDCTGGSKLKAEDGIATLFEKGGKWEIVTDFKNAPTHKSGGKDIYIQGKKVEVEKNELRIENDFGDVAVIPSKYRVEVEDAIKFNCYSCIDGIVEELPKMKDYAGDGTVFPFFGRYKRFKNSLPNNLKNTPEYDYAMRYYWKHNNKPKSFDESINRERPMFTMEDDGYYHAPSVEPNTLRFLKPKNHPTLQYELDWYNSDNPDAVDFRSKYNLDTSDKFYKYVPKKK